MCVCVCLLTGMTFDYLIMNISNDFLIVLR